MGLGTELSKSVVVEYSRFRDDGGHYDLHANCAAQKTFREKFQDFGLYSFNQVGKTQDCLEEKDAKCGGM